MSSRVSGGDSKSIPLWSKVLLAFLILIIVGLTIGIIIVTNKNQDSNTPSEQADYHLPEEPQGGDLSPGDQVIRDVAIMSQSPDYTYTDIEEYYDTAISKAIDNDDHYLTMDIMIKKISYIANTEEDCERAVEYFNNIDLSRFSQDEKNFLISHILSRIDCEDELRGEEE